MGNTDEAWQEVGSHFTRLGSKFKEHYGSQEDTEEIGPDLKDAFRGLATAVERVASTIGDTVRDEDVRAEAKAAASSFVDALGATFGEVGAEIDRVVRKTAPTDDSQMEDAAREVAEAAGDAIPTDESDEESSSDDDD